MTSTIDAAQIRDHVRENRNFYLFEGLILLFMGGLAVIVPWATALTINLVLAIAFLASGCGRLLSWRHKTIDHLWRLLGAILFIVTGLLMLFFPAQSILTLAVVLGFALILEGVLEIGMFVTWKQHPFSGWILASGILSFGLGLMMLFGYVQSGAFYLALFVAAYLILSGLTVLMLAWGANRL